VLSVVLYLQGPSVLGGINSGVISTGVNALVVLVWRLLAPGPEREPVARGARREDPQRRILAAQA
jgi:SSS family solute:Na+ symporter